MWKGEKSLPLPCIELQVSYFQPAVSLYWLCCPSSNKKFKTVVIKINVCLSLHCFFLWAPLDSLLYNPLLIFVMKVNCKFYVWPLFFFSLQNLHWQYIGRFLDLDRFWMCRNEISITLHGMELIPGDSSVLGHYAMSAGTVVVWNISKYLPGDM